jgi:hypothetical protein
MSEATVLERGLGMPEMRERAEALGISPGGMEKTELVHAIQKAEGHTPCFGESNGQCPNAHCCFRQDCLGTESAPEVSVLEGALGLSAKVPWPVTIKEEWFAGGVLVVPRRLANYMAGTYLVHILYDGVDEVLPYEEGGRVIRGINDFYSAKAIAEGDKVYLQLQALQPTRLSLYSSWKRPLDELLRMPLKDWNWRHNSLRDCIIITLARFERPADCREIHSAITVNRNVSFTSIIRILSRYCPRIFEQVGVRKWRLADWVSRAIKT